MNKAFNNAYKNEQIRLDGTAWERCSFNNCEIIINTGDTTIENCHFNDCKLILEGNAETIVKIIELFFPGKLPFATNRPDPFYKGPKLIK